MGRGTLECPGLFLGLGRGGGGGGGVFRLLADQADHELTLLWRREMLTGAYIPRWLKARTQIGTDGSGIVPAIAMTINRAYSRGSIRVLGWWATERPRGLRATLCPGIWRMDE